MCINSLTFILKNRPSENSSILLLNHYLSVFFSGEPAQYDPTFNGPIRKRGCTDIICCVLFMVVILGYMAVGILAWLYGDPRHVLYPRNSTGMFCGIGLNSFMNHQTSSFLTLQVCVEKCPDVFWALNPLAYLPSANPQDYFNQSLCVPSFDLASTKLVSPTLFLRRFYSASCCFVSETLSVITSVNRSFPGLCCSDIVNISLGSQWFKNIDFSGWLKHLISLSLVLSTCLSVGIYHCWWEYDNYRKSTVSITDIGFTTDFKVYLQVKETWLAFLIILSVVEGILLLTLIFLRTRILIAIALIQESSKAVSHMMSTLFYPLVTFVLLVVCVAYWGITALYLATSGNPVYKVVTLNSTQGNCGQIGGNVTCDPQVNYSWCPSARCIFIKYNNEGLLQRNLFNLQIYNVVAFLWCINFVIALGQCTLAGAFASYYWAFSKPSDIPTFPLSQAFIRTLRYHVGSLAFGALILTLIQVVRIILEYLDHKTRAAQNPCARFLMCCLKCCFWCLEKFIKFLNRNAYIMIAVYGKNFCVSAKNAFMLLMRNIVRVVVLDKVTDLLLFFGKLLVVGGVGVLAFFFFSGRIRLPGSNFRTEMLNYYWMPIIVVVVGAYLIAHGFFSVYNMCVDTLFLCFLEDLERHDGTIQKPYYMSKNLMKILNKKNKGPKKGKGKD
uniref:Choline transporter-like protein n=1 Tax=Oncorhynchus tshawytscha TaxID=74940 RepID=A0A8C8HVL0_ONCTS